MQLPGRIGFKLLMLVLISCAGHGVISQETDSHTLKKLTAFARTFGYVRYFHPSDQASLVDWNKMAIFGVQRVLNSDDQEPTEDVLRELFSPVVVDFELYRGDKKPDPELKDVPADEILAWQHYGVGISDRPGIYRSERINRSRKVAAGTSPFGNMMQIVDAAELRGREIRYRFQARVVEGECRLQGWLRVDRESKNRGLFDNMGRRPIRDKQWKQYEISGMVDDDANKLNIGVMMMGTGSGLIDDASLEIKDGGEWTGVKISNPSFESGSSRPSGWGTVGNGFNFKIYTEDAADGDKSLMVSQGSSTRQGGFLSITPKMGEVVDAALVDDLRIRMPLVLAAGESYKSGDNAETDMLLDRIDNFDVEDTEQNLLCPGNVVIAWNIFQHFYPYFEQVDTDWQRVLQDSLAAGLKSETRADTTQILSRLVAQLHDGHGRVTDMNTIRKRKFLPVTFGWVEDKLVVLASNVDDVKIGDVVTAIDGQPAAERISELEELISGSPQWKRYRALGELASSHELDALTLQIQSDSAVFQEIKFDKQPPPRPEKRKKIDLVVEGDNDEENVFYVDLGRVTPQDVRPQMSQFASARGIIFDMRGYPRGTQFLFQHMTDQHLQSAKWQVPQQIRPDRVDIKGEIETIGRWEMPPQKPRFKGKFVFITNGSAISYAESCMAIIANYQLAEIVGSPTAGANGNVNPFKLPGDYSVAWTGMRVMNHDDSQHHVRGVQPTIPMEPSLKGIREGRDELFEKALEVVTADK